MQFILFFCLKYIIHIIILYILIKKYSILSSDILYICITASILFLVIDLLDMLLDKINKNRNKKDFLSDLKIDKIII
jgi:hypothetical protein